MKRMMTWLLAIIVCTSAGAQQRSLQHLVGTWEAVDSENQSGGLEVLDSTRIYLVYGKEKRAATACTFDFSKTPCWFDFTLKDSTGTLALKSILRFISDDLIQWQVMEGGTRPAQFSEGGGEVVYLRRKKPVSSNQ